MLYAQTNLHRLRHKQYQAYVHILLVHTLVVSYNITAVLTHQRRVSHLFVS